MSELCPVCKQKYYGFDFNNHVEKCVNKLPVPTNHRCNKCGEALERTEDKVACVNPQCGFQLELFDGGLR